MVAAYATPRARPDAAPRRPFVMPEMPAVIVTFALGAGLALLGSLPMTGPLALLVIDRLIVAQRRSALWIAFAGALVEGFIAALVATLLPLFLRHSDAIVRYARISGSLVIFAVGITLTLRPELLDAIKTDRKRQSLSAGFLTTALNPTLLATWTVTVTALHDGGLIQGGLQSGLAFGSGALVGSFAWFVFIALIAGRVPVARLTGHRRTFARAIGTILALLGAVLFARAVL